MSNKQEIQGFLLGLRALSIRGHQGPLDRALCNLADLGKSLTELQEVLQVSLEALRTSFLCLRWASLQSSQLCDWHSSVAQTVWASLPARPRECLWQTIAVYWCPACDPCSSGISALLKQIHVLAEPHMCQASVDPVVHHLKRIQAECR